MMPDSGVPPGKFSGAGQAVSKPTRLSPRIPAITTNATPNRYGSILATERTIEDADIGQLL